MERRVCILNNDEFNRTYRFTKEVIHSMVQDGPLPVYGEATLNTRVGTATDIAVVDSSKLYATVKLDEGRVLEGVFSVGYMVTNCGDLESATPIYIQGAVLKAVVVLPDDIYGTDKV